jgi:hypothetical protein
LRERQFAVDDFGADGPEDLPQFGLGPGGAEEPGRGADDGDRFVAQDVGGDRPGDPVESVLERAGIDALYSGVAKQDGVGPAIWSRMVRSAGMSSPPARPSSSSSNTGTP